MKVENDMATNIFLEVLRLKYHHNNESVYII